MGAAPVCRRSLAVLLAVAAVLCVAGRSAAHPALTGTGRLPAKIWALEVDRTGVSHTTQKTLLVARAAGVNALLADPSRLTRLQVARARSLAAGARLTFLQVTPVDPLVRATAGVSVAVRWRCRVLHKAHRLCIPMTASVSVAMQLAKGRFADLVVVRRAGPSALPKVAKLPTPLLALAGLRSSPSFATSTWKAAITAASTRPSLNLGVTPTGTTWKTALAKYLALLGAKPLAGGEATPVPAPTAPDTTAPAPPADVTAARVIGSTVTVSWTASIDPTTVGYRLFLNGADAGSTT
jgi:hypothetical protein